MSNSRIRLTAYWIATILGPTSFVIGGVLLLRHDSTALAGLTQLGYPIYFATFLGVAKLFGAVAITLPSPAPVKEWAYAGFTFDLIAAAFSHAAVGDRAEDVIAPLIFLTLVVASYALRPAETRRAERQIAATTATPNRGWMKARLSEA